MTCRRDRHLTAAALAILLAAPLVASAASRGDGELEKAAAAIARGDGIGAEVAADAALAAGAAEAAVAAFAGEAQLLQGNLVEARRWLEPERFSAATRARGMHALGQLELAEGNLAAAATAFDKAMAAGGGSSALWLDIARLRYRNGQHHLVLQAVETALQIDPESPRALEIRALLARDSDGLAASLPWFERALKAVPDDPGLLAAYGETLAETGRYADMLAIARRLAEVDPRAPQPFFLQAVLAARAGQDNLARRLLWRTGDSLENQPSALLLLGVLELRSGNPRLAVETFDRLARMQPENRRVRQLLGRALLSNGEANEVVARYAPLADRIDADPYTLALVGRAWEQLGERARAAPYLDRAGRPAPSVMTVLPVFGEAPAEGGTTDAGSAVPRLRSLLVQGRPGEARELAQDLQRRFPGSADVERVAGDALLLAGAADAALAAYERAGRIRTDWPLVERMALAEQTLGQPGRARDRVLAFVRTNPAHPVALALLGRTAARAGDAGTAAAYLGAANARRRASDPALLAALAEAQAAAGRTAAGRASAMRAYSLQRWAAAPTRVLARLSGKAALAEKSAAVEDRLALR